MKFSCEQCHAKYTIADERVAGKKLKIRCKKCGGIITVKGTDFEAPLATHPLTGEYQAVSKVLEAAPAVSAVMPAAEPAFSAPAYETPAEPGAPREPFPEPPAKEERAIHPVQAGKVVEEGGLNWRAALDSEAETDWRKARPWRSEESKKEVVKESPRAVTHTRPPAPPPPEEPEPPPPAAGPAVEWFYSKGGKQMGPVSVVEMKELMGARTVGPKTFVWRDGMDDWKRLSTVAEFADDLKVAGEQQEKKATDEGVFDSVLKDVSKAAGRQPAEWYEVPGMPESRQAEATEPAVQAEPPKPAEPAGKAAEAGEALVQQQAGPAAEAEDLPFSTGVATAGSAHEDFDAAMRDEMSSQSTEKSWREPTVRTQSYLPVAVVEEGKPAPAAYTQESTRVVILKAGISAKNKIKRLLTAAVITTCILAGVAWLATSQKSLKFIKTIAQKVTKSEYVHSSSPMEDDMTPEEREKFRKALLGIEEKKKQEILRKRTAAPAGTTPLAAGSQPPADPMLKDAYNGIAKGGEAAPARIDMPGALDPSTGIGALGTGVSGTAGVDLGRKEARAEFRPEAGPVSSRYSTDQINRVISGNQRKLRQCTEKYMKQNAELAGKVQLRIDVKPSGAVVRARNLNVRLSGTMIEECILKEIRTWQFPAFEGEDTTVDLTLILAASM
jgi:predicted Zn finger-like uncharacterized protein